MRREDVAALVLWAVVIIAVAAVASAASAALSQIVAAIIGAAAVLLGAILTHALAAFRQQRIEQQREMQRNYAAIIEKMDEVIRSSGTTPDSFSKIHLATWIVGSERVVLKTQEFLRAQNGKEKGTKLHELLRAMRRDIGLPKVRAEITGVFPSQPGICN